MVMPEQPRPDPPDGWGFMVAGEWPAEDDAGQEPPPLVQVGRVLLPARFTLGGTHISLLELSLGAGTDAPGLGRLYGLTLLEVGVAL